MTEFDVTEKLKQLSNSSEMIFVGALYKEPSLFHDYNVGKDLMMKSGMGKFYYNLLKKIVNRSEYEVVDRLSLNTFVSSQNQKVNEHYNRIGGYDTLADFIEVSEVDNIEQYYLDLLKLNALRKLNSIGFDLAKRWEYYMSLSYKELADSIEGVVAETFSGQDLNEDKVVDLKYGMEDMLDEIMSQKYTGLPVASNCLNAVINGLTLGDITLMAGMSGVGKTFLTITLLMPTVIKYNMPILIMCNEEDANKWRWSILIWIANNVISKREGFQSMYVDKARMFDGNISPQEMAQLQAANEWYKEKLKDNVINFVSFSSFSMDKAIRLIKQYTTQYNVKYFVLDTFKLDNDIGSEVTDMAWLQLQQNIVKLYNVIKESNKNCHVWMTYQLNKTPRRFLDQSSLGMSKNVADVVSTLILARKVYENEKSGESKAHKITVKNKHGEEKTLNSETDYMVLFIDKNRSGSTSKQVVLKTDKGKNILKDVGYTQISEDF